MRPEQQAPPGGGTVNANLYYKVRCQICSAQAEDGSVAVHWGIDMNDAEGFSIDHVNNNPDHVVDISMHVLVMPEET